MSVRPNNHKGQEGLILEIGRKVTIEELTPPNEIRDEMGAFIEKRMRPYKEILTEVSQLMEGFFSIMFRGMVPPKFDPDRAVVNVLAENAEEQEMLTSGKVTRGFGSVFSEPPKPLYQWSDGITASIPKASKHLPAFSFIAQAIRSQERNDQEVAFFLYFRIIDGYFADGAKDVEKALLARAEDLKKYLPYSEEKLREATRAILSALKLPSGSSKDFSGLISDIVLIRHKLIHFSTTNADRHHATGIKYDLNILNHYLRRACVLVVRDQMGI